MIDPVALRDIFDRAVSLPAAERTAFLTHACGNDTALRRGVERLLAADARFGSVSNTADGSRVPDGAETATVVSTPRRFSLAVGARLGPYEITAVLGAGGMGEVYKARDTRLDRTVALKVLTTDLSGHATAKHRFDREARAVAALSHPHICPLFDVGHQDDIDFLVMEYLEGETLAARLARGKLSLGEALTYASQIGAALAAAHRAGIVHRDLKPANVMLTPGGGARLLDFGLAKRRLPPVVSDVTAPPPESLTQAGMILGTVQYMAPEQLEGGVADERTDIFAFGVVLYEMVAGRRAFEGGSNAALIGNILHADPPSPSSIEPLTPHALDGLVRRCLAKDPQARWPSVADVQRELAAVRDAALPVRRWPAVRPTSAMATLLGVSALVGFGVWRWTQQSSAPTRTPESAPVQRNLMRLTFDPGLQTDPTFSPDGRFIAYASDRTGNFDIWVQQLSGGDALQVTKSAAHDTQPSWSPDGSTIAFRSERDGGGLYLVPALGGPERRVVDYGVHPSWSPDGKEIQFRTERLALWEHAAGLFGAPLDGQPPHQILPEFTAMGSWSWISAHPDGRISFLGSHRKLGYGFFTVSNNREVTDAKLLKHIPDALFEMRWNRRQRFHWNNKGTELLLETDANGGVQNIWRVRVDPATLEWTSAERLTTGSGSDVAATFSPDAAHVIFSAQRTSERLWQFDFDPGHRRVSDGQPLTEESGGVIGSDISSDGLTATYFLGIRGQGAVNVWLMPLDSRRPALLAADAFAPVWSSDRRRIAYVKFRGDFAGPKDSPLPVRALALREVGGNDRLISPWSTTELDPMDWLSDGRALLVGAAGQVVIWPVSNPAAKVSSHVALAVEGAELEQARLSPNKRWLGFVMRRANRPTVSEIGVTTADGPQNRQWTPVAPKHQWLEVPRWAPDAKTLYFFSTGSSRFLNLWGIAFDPDGGNPIGEPFQVTRYDSGAFGIIPSGLNVFDRKVFMTMHSATGNIWMLDNVDH